MRMMRGLLLKIMTAPPMARSGYCLVVTKAAKHALGSAEASESLHYFLLRGRIPAEVIAGQRDEVGFQVIG